MKKLSLLFALCLPLLAQATETAIPPPWTELAPMLESDQQGRLRLRTLTADKAADAARVRALWDQQHAIDTANMKRLAELLDQHGWPPRTNPTPARCPQETTTSSRPFF